MLMLAPQPATATKIPSSGDDRNNHRIIRDNRDSTIYPKTKNYDKEMSSTKMNISLAILYKYGNDLFSPYTWIPPERFNETTRVNVLVYRNTTRNPANLVVNFTFGESNVKDFGPFEPGHYLFVARNNISTMERTYHLLFSVSVCVLMNLDLSIVGFYVERRLGLENSMDVIFCGMLAHDKKLEDVQATSFSLEFYTSEERTPDTLWSEVNVTEIGLYMILPRGMNYLVVKRGIEKQDVNLDTSKHDTLALYFSPENDSILDVHFVSSHVTGDDYPYPYVYVGYGIYYNNTRKILPPEVERETVIDITMYRVINGTELREHPFRKFNISWYTWFGEGYEWDWFDKYLVMIKGTYLVEATLNNTLHASRIVNISYPRYRTHGIIVIRDVNATWLDIVETQVVFYDSVPHAWDWPLVAGVVLSLAGVIIVLIGVLVISRILPKKPN